MRGIAVGGETWGEVWQDFRVECEDPPKPASLEVEAVYQKRKVGFKVTEVTEVS